MAAGGDPHRVFPGHVVDGRVVEDVAPVARDRLHERGEVFHRVEERLAREEDACPVHQRDPIFIGRTEPEPCGEVRFGLEGLARRVRPFAIAIPDRFMEITRHPLEVAVDVFGIDGRRDLIDRDLPGIPDRTRAIFTEVTDQISQAQVGHVCQVCGGVAGIDMRGTTTIDERDGQLCVLDEAGSRHAGQARPDIVATPAIAHLAMS